MRLQCLHFQALLQKNTDENCKVEVRAIQYIVEQRHLYNSFIYLNSFRTPSQDKTW